MGLFDWLKKDNKNVENEKEIEKNIQSEELVAKSEDEFISNENIPSDDADSIVPNTTLDKAEIDTENSGEYNEQEKSDGVYNHEEIEKTTIDTELNEHADDETDNCETVLTDNESHDLPEDNEPKGFFAKIKAGLSKTRENIMSGVESVLKNFTSIDEEFYEELEEALIMSDVGVETSTHIISLLKEKVKKDKIKDVADVRAAIVEVIADILNKSQSDFKLTPPTVLLVIGVNGVGKTTTIGKLTNIFKKQGKNVLLAAADTFRAAAIDQLEVWADRNDVKLIKHEEGSDPGAVVFDAVQAAKSRKADILICDTAGRLHNKKNLMDELKKISKIINKEYSDAQVETLLVLDATTGQNALQQAKLFNEVADITGIVLTKLDGTAKGGVVIAISNELDIPVRFIGVGEGMEDLQLFNSNEFAKALFDTEQ
jgi:fused signal recognition particle receptor